MAFFGNFGLYFFPSTLLDKIESRQILFKELKVVAVRQELFLYFLSYLFEKVLAFFQKFSAKNVFNQSQIEIFQNVRPNTSLLKDHNT